MQVCRAQARASIQLIFTLQLYFERRATSRFLLFIHGQTERFKFGGDPYYEKKGEP